MPGELPSFYYPFAVQSLNSLTQFFVAIYGFKYSIKFKITYGFYGGMAIMIVLPLAGHFISDVTAKFWACFVILIVFGHFAGTSQA